MQVFFKIYLFFYVLIKHTQKYIDEYIVLLFIFLRLLPCIIVVKPSIY